MVHIEKLFTASYRLFVQFCM